MILFGSAKNFFSFFSIFFSFFLSILTWSIFQPKDGQLTGHWRRREIWIDRLRCRYSPGRRVLIALVLIALPTRSGGIAVAKCMKKRTGRRWVEGMGDPIERERERERELRLMIFRLDPPLGSPSLFRFSRLSWCARPIFFFSLFLYNAAQIDSW